MKRKYSIPDYNHSEAAFTLIEAAASIAILALIALIGFSVVSGAGRRLLVFGSESIIAGEYIRLETTLRRTLAEIKPPYYAPLELISESKNKIILPYWKGIPNNYVNLSFADGLLTIESPRGKDEVGPFDEVHFSILRNDSGTEIGVKTTIDNKGSTLTISSVFSSIPLFVELKE